ncbi:mismatch repair protein MSH3 ASCRUDRAFT_74141 [Ascoidea rubescens DSM 1968]|uniref:DNA mismatch repair protein n=1 Tax=Ascoidea rubescens DSM 1968 TaxID=1344418 RepID=A0A1D2VSI6_9ASCO|nr:hypothetical protein ASCRUDRAFT_74141 [Ascoidea rubescens DSM 1968]ODV64537.1 hypothetical protein ASCRUDRAFT_74141 [Ascoidea rubescens DSM 1968]
MSRKSFFFRKNYLKKKEKDVLKLKLNKNTSDHENLRQSSKGTSTQTTLSSFFKPFEQAPNENSQNSTKIDNKLDSKTNSQENVRSNVGSQKQPINLDPVEKESTEFSRGINDESSSNFKNRNKDSYVSSDCLLKNNNFSSFVDNNTNDKDSFQTDIIDLVESSLTGILNETNGTPMKKHLSLNDFKFEKEKIINTHEKDKNTNYSSKSLKRNLEDLETPFNRKFSNTKKIKLDSKKVKLTPLEQQYVDLKLKNLDKILMIQSGYKYIFYASDAVIASETLHIMLMAGKLSIDFNNPNQNDYKYDKLAHSSIPIERLHIHIKRLISHGFKVGVVEQIESSNVKKLNNDRKLFKRDLTQVYTSATYIEDYSNDDVQLSRKNNYVICLIETSTKENNKTTLTSLVAVQPSTGEIIYDQFEDSFLRSELESRLLYFNSNEFVLINGLLTKTSKEIFKKKFNSSIDDNIKVKKYDNIIYENYYKHEIVGYINELNLPNADELRDFVLSLDPNVYKCIYHLIEYLKEFNLDNIFQIISNYSSFQDLNHMVLGSQTIKNLEIFQNSTNLDEEGSLLWLLDNTCTKNGYRLLKSWILKPLTNKVEIEKRLNSVEDLVENFKFSASPDDNKKSSFYFLEILVKFLKKSNKDLEKSIMRVHYQKCSRKEIYLFLRDFCEIVDIFLKHYKAKSFKVCFKSDGLHNIFNLLFNTTIKLDPVIKTLLEMINISVAMDESDFEVQKLNFFNRIETLLQNKNFESQQNVDSHSFIFKNNEYTLFLETIDEIKSKIDIIEGQFEDELKCIRRLLKRSALKYSTVSKEAYLVEVSNNVAKTIPKDWLKISKTKKFSRFRTPNCTDLLKQKNVLHEKLVLENERFFKEIFLREIDKNLIYFNKIVKYLSILDCLLSLAVVSSKMGYVKPKFYDDSKTQQIEIKEGRNPIIEQFVSQNGYISNDFEISDTEGRISILTGPNMGGKSSFVKQLALIVIMAQIGCYVPAYCCSLSIFNSIHIRMGAEDNILENYSTFMVEMLEVSNIIHSCNSKSLVIFDEVGRGTGTIDGTAIAYAILNYFLDEEISVKPLILFITHFTSLSDLELSNPRIVRNYHMGFIEDKNSESNQLDKFPTITFLYTLVKGISKSSYGLNAAKLAQLPEDILEKAWEISKQMQNDEKKAKERSWLMEARRLIMDIENKSFSELKHLTNSL